MPTKSSKHIKLTSSTKQNLPAPPLRGLCDEELFGWTMYLPEAQAVMVACIVFHLRIGNVTYQN
jgi:hypothetical protein